MNITIVQSKLSECLKKVQAAANAKMINGICGNVLVAAKGGKVAFTTTNLDIILHCETECEVKEEGVMLLPMARFLTTVSVLPVGDVTISEKGSRISVKGGTAAFTFPVRDVREFPTFDAESEKFSMSVPSVMLRSLLKKTAYAQSSDDTRKTLSSVLMAVKDGKIRCVATDGRRLAISEDDVKGGECPEASFIIPSESVAVLQKFADAEGDIAITALDGKVKFSVDGYQFYTKLVDGEYPAYSKVIPQTSYVTATIDRENLITVMNRVSVMALTDATAVSMSFSNNLLKVSVIDENGDANDEIPVKYEGEDIEIKFNPKYVLDPLKAATADEITISLTNGHSPAVFKGIGERFMCVLMPLRIN